VLAIVGIEIVLYRHGSGIQVSIVIVNSSEFITIADRAKLIGRSSVTSTVRS
jgi:hypothetical protein